MTMAREVHVRCPDHHQALVDGLWNFFNTQHGVDLEMRGTRIIRAHRLIVEVFMSPVTSTELIISKTEPSLSDHLDLLVEFLYRGQVSVKEEQLESLRRVAQELNFKMLADALIESTLAVDLKSTPTATSASKPRRTVLRARRGSRKQRKGNPVKVISPTDGESRIGQEGAAAGKEWTSAGGRRLRATRCRRGMDTLKESSDEDVEGEEAGEDWSASADEDSDSERKRAESTPATPAANKKKVAARLGGGAVERKRKVGRPKATTKNRRQPTLKCTHCPYKTYCRTRFQVHAARHDPSVVIFRCATCSKPFLTEEAFEGHRASHACEPKIFSCPHCPYQTAKKVAHQIHLAKHDPSVAIFKCETCHRPFSCRESLERHQLRHRIYNCPHCTFVTPKGGSYHHHLRSVHKVNTKGEAAQKRFKCSDCTKTYMYESELKYHSVAMHSGEKPFRCPQPQCPYSTGRKVDVKRHIKVAHENIKPYLCENCGFRAVTPFNLERHRLSHTGLKPYKCDACGQSFADRDTLKRHSRLHFKNDKPFVCHVCGHAFNRRHNLKVHLKNVHKTPMEPEAIKL